MNRYYVTVPTTYNDGTPVTREDNLSIAATADRLFPAYSIWTGAYGVWEGMHDSSRTFVIDQNGPERNIIEFATFVKTTLKQECVYVADHPIHTRLV